MDTDEDIRPVFPGDLPPLSQGDKVIPLSGKKGLVSPRLEDPFQLVRYAEDHILLARPPPA